MFSKAGRHLARPEPPDLEIDLSLGWKAVDRKANGETDFIGNTEQSSGDTPGTAEAKEESIVRRDRRAFDTASKERRGRRMHSAKNLELKGML